MTTSRRKFVQSGLLAALFAGFCFDARTLVFGQEGGRRGGAGTVSSTVPDEAKMDDVFYFKKATFDPYLNTEFSVRLGVTTTKLKLVEIVDCTSGASAKGANGQSSGDCFVLIFKANRQFPKGIPILPLQHAALGKFELSLEKWKNFTDPKGIYYQATINHSQPPVVF
ncbi:MAG TPA: hypothetical protein VGC66_01995 [Pyrinomonadaceae bacterium]|jgi:hypothetical protein